MITVWKYPLEGRPPRDFMLSLPAGARPLYVGVDIHFTPHLWCLVDSEQPPVSTRVWIFGTGETIAEGGILASAWGDAYVGSYTLGPFLWHVFVGEPR